MVIEQEDGFRLDFDNAVDQVIYLKKSDGWTSPLVTSMQDVLETAYDNGFDDGRRIGY